MYTRLVYKIVFRQERAVEIPVSAVSSNIYYTIYYNTFIYCIYVLSIAIILLYYIPSAVIDDDVAIAPGHVQSCFEQKC